MPWRAAHRWQAVVARTGLCASAAPKEGSARARLAGVVPVRRASACRAWSAAGMSMWCWARSSRLPTFVENQEGGGKYLGEGEVVGVGQPGQEGDEHLSG